VFTLTSAEANRQRTRRSEIGRLVVKTVTSAQSKIRYDLLERAFTRSAGSLYKRQNFFHDYVTHDPHFRRDCLLGLYRDDLLISTCQVFTRTLAIGERIFSLQGLGNIATDPRFQRQEFCSGLLRWVIDHPAGRRDLSILYSGSPGFYTRLGWQPETSRVLRVERIPAWRPPAMAGARIRKMRAHDRPSVATIYAVFNRTHEIPHVIRSSRYWDSWIMDWKLKVYGLTAEVIVDRDGELLGYVFHVLRGNHMTVEEYGAIPGAIERVVRAVLRQFQLSRNADRLIFLCATPPLEQALHAENVPFERSPMDHGSGCIYLFNESLNPWLDKICLWHVDHF